MKTFKFLDADHCPMRSTGGWAVPNVSREGKLFGSGELEISGQEARRRLTEAGFVEGQDFKIHEHPYTFSPNTDLKPLKRVVFYDDETFIMAKMVL